MSQQLDQLLSARLWSLQLQSALRRPSCPLSLRLYHLQRQRQRRGLDPVRRQGPVRPRP